MFSSDDPVLAALARVEYTASLLRNLYIAQGLTLARVEAQALTAWSYDIQRLLDQKEGGEVWPVQEVALAGRSAGTQRGPGGPQSDQPRPNTLCQLRLFP